MKHGVGCVYSWRSEPAGPAPDEEEEEEEEEEEGASFDLIMLEGLMEADPLSVA